MKYIPLITCDGGALSQLVLKVHHLAILFVSVSQFAAGDSAGKAPTAVCICVAEDDDTEEWKGKKREAGPKELGDKIVSIPQPHIFQRSLQRQGGIKARYPR